MVDTPLLRVFKARLDESLKQPDLVEDVLAYCGGELGLLIL